MIRSLLISACLIVCAAFRADAQLCVPDPSYTQPGIYPDASTNVSPGCAGQFYIQDFTLVVPPDTTIAGFNFTINYMRIDSVSGLPPGLQFACNPSNCTFPGNSRGCVNLYGIPPVTGSYSLTVYVSGTASNPFFGTFNIPLSYSGYVLRVGAAPTLTSGSTPSLCVVNSGTAWTQATGPMSYSYQWNTVPPSSNDTAFNLAAGVYQVTVSDTLGCATTDTVIVSNVGGPAIDSVAKTNVLCNGGNSGTATVYSSGGSIPYTYAWSQGGTNASVSGLAASTYTITVSDANGCQSSSLVTITEPFAIVPGLSHTDVSCNGAADGTASSLTAGGVFPYMYSWSNSGTGSSISGLSAGTYSVTITDDNGCTATSSVSVTEPAAINITAGHTDVSCFGGTNGAGSVSVSGGAGPYDYSWNNGDTTAAVSGLAAGTYSVLVTDASGCTSTASFTVTEPSQITVTINAQNTLCAGSADGSASAVVSGGTPGYLYAWSNGDTTVSAAGLSAGSYTVTVTDAQNCTASSSSMITSPPAIVLSLSATHESGAGTSDGAVNATVTGGTIPYTFDWSNGASTEDISGLPAGNYVLEVTDVNGCTLSDTITVFNLSGTEDELQEQWKIYPNPTEQYITVTSVHGVANATARILDMSGKTVYSLPVAGATVQLDLGQLPGGAYLLEITEGKQSYRYRIIKQ